MNNKPATPRCPYCNGGLDTLATNIISDVRIIFCGLCGAILGCVPYQIAEEKEIATAIPKAKTLDPEMERLAQKYGPKSTPKQLLKQNKPLTKSELGAMAVASKGGLFHEVFKPNNESESE